MTWPLLTLIAPLPCPDSTFTSWAGAARLTWIQVFAIWGLVTILCTWVWTNPAIALASDGAKVLSSVPTRGKPWLLSEVAAWLA